MAFLTGKELRLYLLVVAVATILALTVTIIVMAVRNGSDGRIGQVQQGEDKTVYTELPVFETGSSVIGKICVPDEYTHLYKKVWRPFRPVYEKWTDEMIQAYWIDPRTLVKEELERQSDSEIAEFFEDIP